MKLNFALLATGLIMLMSSCGQQYPPTDMTEHSIIPKPVSVAATNGTFVLNNDVAIYYDAGNSELKENANYLAALLRPATGFDLNVEATESTPGNQSIFLTTNAKIDTTLGSESYELKITEDMARIASTSPAGVFFGIQTMRQLLPPEIEGENQGKEEWYLPTGNIRDWPEYGYRGAMLDVSRHFFDVATVKRVIDYMALYKLNMLHLHLSDDQGWRIEIESWPKLTEVGGSTEVGGGEGGYYTKEDYKEIVSYAADRHITIVPEIDMPGHTNAALASYA